MYCLASKNIKLYYTQTLSQLNGFNKDCHEFYHTSRKPSLDLPYNTMKAIKNYIIQHLKLYKLNFFVEHKNQIHFNLLNSRYRLLLYFNCVHVFIERQYTIPKNIEHRKQKMWKSPLKIGRKQPRNWYDYNCCG